MAGLALLQDIATYVSRIEHIFIECESGQNKTGWYPYVMTLVLIILCAESEAYCLLLQSLIAVYLNSDVIATGANFQNNILTDGA